LVFLVGEEDLGMCVLFLGDWLRAEGQKMSQPIDGTFPDRRFQEHHDGHRSIARAYFVQDIHDFPRLPRTGMGETVWRASGSGLERSLSVLCVVLGHTTGGKVGREAKESMIFGGRCQGGGGHVSVETGL
jgi:hypothetical protein